MKRPLVVAALVIAAVAIAADVKMGTSTDYSTTIGGRTAAGKNIPLKATDAGELLIYSAPCYMRTFHQVGTLVSTGSTNNGTLVNTIPAGSCIEYQCSSATYIGAVATLNADGGPAASVPSCLSLDGGSIFGCPLASANAKQWKQLAPTENSLAGVSASGTANCAVGVSNY